MPSQPDVTMIRVTKPVAARLRAAPGVLKMSGKNKRIRAADALLNEAMDRSGVPKAESTSEQMAEA
jgi:hypothetical protein